MAFLQSFSWWGRYWIPGALFTQTAAINWESAKAIYLSGVPINCIHGVATFLTLFFFSRPLFEKLDRVQLKYGMMEDGYGV